MSIGIGLSTTGVKQITDWVPTNISNCMLWLRSDLGITLNGSTVSAWADQSGNGNNMSQGTVANQPTYQSSDSTWGNKPSILFNGTHQLLVSTGATAPNVSQPNTIYVMVNVTTTNGGQSIFDADGASGRQFLQWVDNTTHGWGLYAGGAGEIFSAPNLTRGVGVFACVFNNGGTSSLYHNSSASTIGTATLGTNALKHVAIGDYPGSPGAAPMTGTVAEFIVYSGAHTTTQIATVFAYAAARYSQNWS